MWLIAEYEPVSLFSLKSSLATSTGGKSVFVPTPFAIRTALVDAAIRIGGLSSGKSVFEWVKGLTMVVSPPQGIVITNMFTKIRKPRRADSKPPSGEQEEDPEEGQEEDSGTAMTPTIGFREYIYWSCRIGIGFGNCGAHIDELRLLLLQVNYFGKRGSFVQIRDIPRTVKSPPREFIPLASYDEHWVRDVYGEGAAMPLGVVQMMDDWGPGLTFDKLNIYSEAKIAAGKDRVLRPVILPYRLIRSSRGFSYYTLQIPG